MNECRRSWIRMCGSPACSNAQLNGFVTFDIGLVLSSTPGKTYLSLFAFFASLIAISNSATAASDSFISLAPVLLSFKWMRFSSSATSSSSRSVISEQRHPVNASSFNARNILACFPGWFIPSSRALNNLLYPSMSNTVALNFSLEPFLTCRHGLQSLGTYL